MKGISRFDLLAELSHLLKKILKILVDSSGLELLRAIDVQLPEKPENHFQRNQLHV